MKKRNFIEKCVLLILTITSFLFFTSCSTIEDGITAIDKTFEAIDEEQENSETHTTLDELIPAICELWADEAIDQYFNKYYHITGTVRQVGSINEINMIILDGPTFAGSDYSITFFFDGSDSIDVLRELQEGDTVTIRGYLDGSDYKDLVRFDFYHCTVNKVTDESTVAPADSFGQDADRQSNVSSPSPEPIGPVEPYEYHNYFGVNVAIPDDFSHDPNGIRGLEVYRYKSSDSAAEIRIFTDYIISEDDYTASDLVHNDALLIAPDDLINYEYFNIEGNVTKCHVSYVYDNITYDTYIVAVRFDGYDVKVVMHGPHDYDDIFEYCFNYIGSNNEK